MNQQASICYNKRYELDVLLRHFDIDDIMNGHLLVKKTLAISVNKTFHFTNSLCLERSLSRTPITKRITVQI